MTSSFAMLIGVAGLLLTVLVAFAAYRWIQRARVRRVEELVKGYLFTRYGQLPDHLNINCTEDSLWPVLVAFERPAARVRHSLQFSCAGGASSFFLLREKEEPCPTAPSNLAHLAVQNGSFPGQAGTGVGAEG